jgi:outer membrane protein
MRPHSVSRLPAGPARSRSCLLLGLVLGLGVWLLTVCLPQPLFANPLPAVRIGVILDGPWEGTETLLDYFQTEIAELMGDEFAVNFPAELTLTGDWSMESIHRAGDRLLSDPRVDQILAIGVLTSHDMALRGPLAKPVIATFTVDRDIQGFPLQNGASGVRNLSYLASPSPVTRDLHVFRELLPFRRLAVLIHRPYLQAIPALAENLEHELAAQGVRVFIVPVERSADEALQALPPGIDAVYVTPLLLLPPVEFQRLVAGLIEMRLPSFTYFGRNEVQQGILAGAAPLSDFPRLARRTALHVQRILLGEEAGRLPVLFSQEGQLVINMATARSIGFSPGWDVLIEADLLAEETEGALRCLSLQGAVREAAAVNLELAAADRQVAAGLEEIRKARAAMLPQLLLSAEGLAIDRGRAEESFGTRAERTLQGSLLLEQSLYSEQRHARLAVEKHRQEGRVQEQRQLRLDIIQQAATAYLNVLRAKTLQAVQKNNLRVTRSNLDLARMRRRVGFSGPAEVYRWESQLAKDRKAVIDADTRRSLAEMALNRILQRPAEEAFITMEVGLSDPDLLIGDPRLGSFLENPASFAGFRNFMVAEGQAAVPELQRIEAAIAAAKRSQKAARRSFWVPELTFQAGLIQILQEEGEGTESPLNGFLPVEIPEADDTRWNLGLNLTLPLFTGGGRRAELGRAGEELARLRLERQVLADRIEQRIRSALQQARASRSGIRLSREGAEAARKNLELVTDAYSRGVVSIIELLDAQNAALAADQAAANAVYDFFIDLMEVQRSVGSFDFFLSDEEKDRWFERLEVFWGRTGKVVPRY